MSSIMKFAPIALKNFFSKPVTVKYPAEPIIYPEGSRGHVVIDSEQCISCGMCQRVCPTGAITVDREAKTWTINRFDCLVCAYCVLKCPKKCLEIKEGYQAPGKTKYSETCTKEPEEKIEPEEKKEEN